MNLNLQNKIHGTRFATVLIFSHGTGKDCTVGVGEIHHLLTDESIREIGIPKDFANDFAEQLQELGGHEKIMEMFRMEPFSGMYNSPLVLRHKKIPQIIAQVIVQDRKENDVYSASYSPNHLYYNAHFVLSCFLDPSVKEGDEYDADEEYLKTFDALSSRRMGMTEEEFEELLKD